MAGAPGCRRVRPFPASGKADRRRGLTLVELLVVVVIVAALVGLILPAVQMARESARRTLCASNMRNLGLAIQQFVTANEFFPPAATNCDDTSRCNTNPPALARHSLFAFILPHYEQATVFNALDFTQHWNDTTNSDNDSLTRQHLGGILLCPSAPGGRESSHVTDFAPAHRIDPTKSPGFRNLIGVNGPVKPRVPGTTASPWGNSGTTWAREWFGILPVDNVATNPARRRTVRPANVRDGMSSTFMLFEDGGKPTIYQDGRPNGATPSTRFRWASPEIYMTIDDFCNGSQLINCDNNSKPYSFHPGGMNILFADGAVQFITESIAADTFVSLFTLQAGDIPGDY